MNTLSATTLIFIQMVITLSALLLERPEFVNLMLLEGSPLNLILHFSEITPIYYATHTGRMLLFAVHTFKYFFLIRAFTSEPRSIQRTLAVVMEIAYLGLSYYYIMSV
ncbi:MAG: hypothetical protein AB7L92_09315 [Alphaproteobacteria bacterium]